MTSSSTTRLGTGEATTRRQPRPESSTRSQPSRSRWDWACSAFMKEPMGLLGLAKAGSLASTSTWVTTVAAVSFMLRCLNSL